MNPTSPKENTPLSEHTNNKRYTDDISKRTGKPCVIIPGYNIAETIEGIIREIKKLGIEVIFIDDGSKDATRQIALESQAIVLNNETNIGKGSSLRKGFEYALNHGYAIIIAMDGDGQHSPGDIPNFLNAVNTSPQEDIVIGNRMNNPKDMPVVRWIINKVMSKIISYVCRQNIPDSQSGFRLIKGACLKSLRLKSERFEIESEIILEAAGKNYRISSIPIHTIYENNKSQINPFRDTIKFIKFLLPYARFYFLKRRNGKKADGTPGYQG